VTGDAPQAGQYAARPRNPGALRVLVVEDDRGVADMLVEALVAEGHEPAVAPDAAMALQMCASFAPGVVLLDIGLPGMNGYAVAEQMRNLPGTDDMRIVAVTGHGHPEDRRRSRTAGFDRHLVKPIDLDALALILRAMAEEVVRDRT
jgi:CheY-like chemotaxis protein